MKKIIYVFIENEVVRCYPNLKQLCDINTKVPYFKAFRALRTSDLFKDEDYVVAKDEMVYKTRRHFSKGTYE
jgi:hypothetical protein